MASISNKLFFLPFANNRNIFISGIYTVCVSVCVYACVWVHDNSKNNGSFNLKFEHMVVGKNSLDEFNFGHCPIRVKVTM